MTFVLEPMQQRDWGQVRAIYAEGLETGIAAFMSRPPLWKDWNAKQLPFGRLVARRSSTILGWGALSPVADT